MSGSSLATDPADRAVPGVVDVEDERLRELGAHVEGGAGGETRLTVEFYFEYSK